MGYRFELTAGQSVYLENLGDQTRVTTISSSPRQQQQSSSGFQTGRWTAPPEAFRAAIGVVVKLYTAEGDRFLHIEGRALSPLPDAPSLREAQTIPVQSIAQVPVTSMPAASPMELMPPMEPMSPMEPMTMGDMQIDRGEMSMQMGNMRMSMNPLVRSQDSPSPTHPSSIQPSPTSLTKVSESSGQRNFCSQCGMGVKPSDRFCASCGHRLD